MARLVQQKCLLIHGAPKGASIFFLPFCGFFVMSKIVDDFMAGVCYDGSMKKGQTRMAGANE